MFSTIRKQRLASVLTLALLAGALPALSLAQSQPNTVHFKNPGQAGTLKINVGHGRITVVPSSEPGQVHVSTTGKRAERKTPEVRDDGLRVLSDTNTPFTLTVKDNAAELTGNSGLGEAGDYDVAVPANTAVQIQSSWGGDISVRGLEGDLSVQSVNSDVTLERFAGGANIELVNGKVKAEFAKLSADKAVSISAMNGEVVLRVPEESKATVRFRTHNGAILTDFSDAVLKTHSEQVGSADWGTLAGKQAAMAAKVAQQISGEIAVQAKEIASQVKEAIKEVHVEIRTSKEETEETAGQGEADKAVSKEEGKPVAGPVPPLPPKAPKPPRPPIRVNIPAMSGGKVVSGTLNEGGAPVQITLMNGDVIFRKASAEAGK